MYDCRNAVEQAVLLCIPILPYAISLLQAPRQAAKLVSAEGRAAALAAALREREACLAAAQAQLLQTEARHAQACALFIRTVYRNANLWSTARPRVVATACSRCSNAWSCAMEPCGLHAHQTPPEHVHHKHVYACHCLGDMPSHPECLLMRLLTAMVRVQVEDSLHAELAARGTALADADRRFAELEVLLQRLSARADAA